MKPMILLLAAGLAAQTPAPQTICGQRISRPDADITVACIDWQALARIGVPVPVGWTMSTQVLVQMKTPADVVRVEVANETTGDVQYSDVVTDAYGQRVAMVQFQGSTFQTLNVRTFTENK